MLNLKCNRPGRDRILTDDESLVLVVETEIPLSQEVQSDDGINACCQSLLELFEIYGHHIEDRSREGAQSHFGNMHSLHCDGPVHQRKFRSAPR